MSGVKHTPSEMDAALKRFVEAKPDPVFTAAFDRFSKGAPGLSERTCEAIARSIAIKVSYLPARATGDRPEKGGAL